MANQYVDPYSLNENVYVDNLDAAIELMKERPDRFNAETEKYFHSIPTDSLTFKMSSVGSVLDLPKINQDEDDLPASAPSTGYDQTFSLVQYRQKVQITDTFMKADRFGKAQRMAMGLPNAMGRQKEYLRTAIFANGFSGTAGADGVSLYSDSHPPENPMGSNRDNLITGALARATWHAMRLLADQQVNERGYPSPGVINELLIHPANRQKAKELQTAELDPETALNTPNVLVDFTINVGHFLASTTAWFGFTDAVMGEDKGMYWMHLEEGNIKDARPSGNPDIIWAKRSKFIGTYGFDVAVDYTYGSAGT